MQARRLGSRAADVSRVANDRLPVRPTGSIPVARTAGFGASRPLWTRVSDGSRSKTPTTRRKRGEATCSTGRGSGLRERQASGRDQTLDRCAYFSAAAGRSAGRAAESLTRCIRKARRPPFAPRTFAGRRAGRHRDARGITGVPPVVCGRYSITVSANPSSVRGMVKLRSFAVLRLSAKSKWVGRSTGKSDGFSPLRICPAYTPTLRNASRMSEP